MSTQNIDRNWIAHEVAEAAVTLRNESASALTLWEHMKIEPVEWLQSQYPEATKFWVIAVLGNKCLYFNEVEGGWGWGRFSDWGVIDGFHWEQFEIHHTVLQAHATICSSID